MAPNISSATPGTDKEASEDRDTLVSTTKEVEHQKSIPVQNGFKIKKTKGYFEEDLKWVNIFSIITLHILAVYCLIFFPYWQKIWLFFYGYVVGTISGLGVTGGAHRLWTHRAYKAKWPLRAILLFSFYLAGQNSMFSWVRDHRVHHKYSDTKADPHDSSRGFFFSHVGWLMMHKNSEVIRRGRQVDMSDILSDPVLKFGEKHFVLYKTLISYVLPVLIPVYLWNEEWKYSIMIQIIRYTLSLNIVWSVNSAAHIWGSKPFDKSIAPSENKLVSLLGLGEGWHNYHHVFPWDYKAAELGNYRMNFTTAYIDMFSKIGWAYDMKEPSKELISAVIANKGDGSHIPEVPRPKSD